MDLKKAKKKINKRDRTTSKHSNWGPSKRENKIYENCKVYSPSGNLMFLCGSKKARWYLDKKDDNTGLPLGKEVRHINPVLNVFMHVFRISPNGLRVKLLFNPVDEGNRGDDYSLAKKLNKCVVTGSENIEELTKHHITPYCYRKYLPDEYKSANSHDIVPITYDEHRAYERKADGLKFKLARLYNAPIDGHDGVDHKLFYAIKAARDLTMHGHKMPAQRTEELKNTIKKYTGKRVTKNTIKELNDTSFDKAGRVKSHGEIVIEKLMLEGGDAIQEFVEMWREHFITHAEPKYMPKHWDVKRPASREDVKNIS